MRHTLLYILILVSALFTPSTAVAGDVLPDDVPTIEMMISLHKMLAKQEDASLAKVTASTAEQTAGITPFTEKWHNVRDVLNTRLNSASSWLVLASAIASSSMDVAHLVKEYGAFTKDVFSAVKRKPFVLWYYTRANYTIGERVKGCYALGVSLAAAASKLDRATMKEKIDLVWQIKAEINEIRGIIEDAKFWVDAVRYDWCRLDPLKEILHDDFTRKIADKVISEWKSS